MSVQYKVLVTCDGQLGGDCHGIYEMRGKSPRDFDNAGVELLQQGWVRTYRAPAWVQHPTSDDQVAIDTCPACFERMPRQEPSS